ncbi:SWI/SNF-related matrix-associated actin-dependent regulator of chromatin subfamily A-like protein 1 isoform X2 [Brachyhypopomus gauderio]|uniref:SWI/SNF-related matrix-associated actin-dependent regulator of chromatin subfamily A-like protein 1 isoform X2 n=1 Tax=Brachyhypopomus gauderio TaxID=698409 RepID=UPI0040416A7D
MSCNLTPEQQERIEENRKRALARRAERLAQGRAHVSAQDSPSSAQDVPPPKRFLPHTTGAPAKCAATFPLNREIKSERRTLIIDPLPIYKRPSSNAESNPSGPSTHFSPPEPKSDAGRFPETKPSSTAGIFYGHSAKPPGQTLKNQRSNVPDTGSGVPAKRPAVCVRGRCVAHSEERFRVEVGYHAELIAVFKNMPSRNYDPTTKMWNFSLEHYQQLMEEVAGIPSVSLKVLDGMEGLDLSASSSRPRDAAALVALMRLCQGWQKPGATVKGQCTLISRSRLEVDVGYNADVIGVFKQMPSRNYDMKTRKWSFLLEDYGKLMEAVNAISAVEIEPLPRAVLQVFSSHFDKSQPRAVDVPEADLTAVDPMLTRHLMPFQLHGVNFAVSREGRLLLADDMGLGKTVQALCIAAYYRREWPLLVVTPSSVRFTWAEAFQRWLPSVAADDINVVVKGRDSLCSGLVNIISYDLLSKMDKQHLASPFGVLIMDESHFLKNVKTARCRAALPLLKEAKRVILLSGTPAMSRPAELYTQILAVRPTLFPRFHEFGVRYCDAKQLPWGWDYSGSSHLTELKLLLEESLMLRRLKADVLSQLPAKQRKVVNVTTDGMDSRTRAALSAAAKELSGVRRSKMQEKEALLVFFNHTAEAKIRAVLASATSASTAPLPQWSGSSCVTGSSSRQRAAWLCSPSRQPTWASPCTQQTSWCSQSSSGTRGWVCVWNPGILIQAEDRVHRIGQTSSVDIHYLVAKGTADDYLWPMIQEKMNVLEQVGLSESNISDKAVCASFHSKDPKQQSIAEMFQRSFSEEDVDESVLLEAVTDWDGTGQQQEHFSTSPSKEMRHEDYHTR